VFCSSCEQIHSVQVCGVSLALEDVHWADPTTVDFICGIAERGAQAREEEIAILVRRWERARQGDGQLVLIVGEPRLGKSRLIEELRIRLRARVGR
jgi:predicted ATPase